MSQNIQKLHTSNKFLYGQHTLHIKNTYYSFHTQYKIPSPSKVWHSKPIQIFNVLSIISYNKNLAILNVKVIELNLRKSHLNRRKLRRKSLQKLLLLLQKLLLLLQKQRTRRRKMLQSYRLFSILL